MSPNIAAWVRKSRGEITIEESPCPIPGQDEVVIVNEAIAIQPLDASILTFAYFPRTYPAILGSNVAGTVVAVGSSVKNFTAGDRVVADTPAYVTNENRFGCWQRYVVSKARTTCKVPPEKSLEDAIAIPFSLLTVVGALSFTMGMETPPNRGEGNVLIWGAGGSVGGYAVQYAASVGYNVIATASPAKFSRVKQLGASVVIDYRDREVETQIKERGPFKYIMCATADHDAVNTIARILQPNGGKFAHVRPKNDKMDIPDNVEMIYKSFSLMTQRSENDHFIDWWYGVYLHSAIAGAITPTPVEVRSGGLGAIAQACQDVVQGVALKKLVIDMRDSNNI